MMELNNSLHSALKRLRLSGIATTMPDRLSYAKKAKLSHQEFLELILQDEIDTRPPVGDTLYLEFAATSQHRFFLQIKDKKGRRSTKGEAGFIYRKNLP